jgi:protein tyrosine/serine phosphatase
LREDHSDSLVLKEPGFIYFNVEFVTKHFTDAEIIKALSIIRSAPKPLLVHCKRGSDRTGAVIAMYRIIFENWTKEKALDEMISGDYGFHKRFKNIPAYIKKVDADSLKQILLK